MEQKKKIQEMVLKEVDSTVYSLRKSLKRRLDAAMESPATTQSMRDPTMATATPHGGALSELEFMFNHPFHRPSFHLVYVFNNMRPVT